MIEVNQSHPLFIRRTQLREIAGISPSTAWRLEQAGEFPKRRQIGGSPNCVGWLYSEVRQYLENCEPVA
jgi:prophage regulatory protein